MKTHPGLSRMRYVHGRHDAGHYWINSADPEAEVLKRYILSGIFLRPRRRRAIETRNRMNQLVEVAIDGCRDSMVQKRIHRGVNYPVFRLACNQVKLWLRNPGRQAMIRTRYLQALGVDSVQVVACWTHRVSFWRREHFYVHRYRQAGCSLTDIRDAALPREVSRPSMPDCMRELGGMVRRMHDAGLWHRDLAPGNVMVQDSDASSPRLFLTDADALRPARGRMMGRRRRRALDLRSLKRMLNHYTRDQLLTFCRGYDAVRPPEQTLRGIERGAQGTTLAGRS